MSVSMLALYGKPYLRLSKTHGTSSTAGVRMPADNRSYRLPRFHLPPAGIDALVNHSVVSHKWVDPVTGFHDPGLTLCWPRCGGVYAVIMLCPLPLSV